MSCTTACLAFSLSLMASMSFCSCCFSLFKASISACSSAQRVWIFLSHSSVTSLRWDRIGSSSRICSCWCAAQMLNALKSYRAETILGFNVMTLIITLINYYKSPFISFSQLKICLCYLSVNSIPLCFLTVWWNSKFWRHQTLQDLRMCCGLLSLS